MRECAAVNGLFVEFRKPPGSDRAGPRARVSSGDIIYYGKRLPAATQVPVPTAAWVRRDGDWFSSGKRRPFPEQLSALSEAIIAVGVDPSSCGVYWDERVPEGQGEQYVGDICRALEAWSGALKS